jgi:opacity protein-like surface antigen
MKKCFIVSVFILMASFSFAQMKGKVEVYSGAMLFNETSGMNGPETVYTTTSLSAGISGGVYFNDTIGLKAYLDFLIPLTFTAGPNGGTAVTREDYDFLLGMDEFFGVVFNVVKTERLTIPVMAGFQGKLFFSTLSDYFTMAANSGIGLGIGVEYAFSNNCYVLARVNGSFDFLGFSIRKPAGNNSNGNEQTGFNMALIRTWVFAPHIGVGIKL